MTTMPMLTFDKDGADGLVLSPDIGAHTIEVDLGYPDVREVVEDRVEHSGTVDRTRHFGARAVSINLIVEYPRDLLDAVGPYCDPGRLCWLFLDDPVTAGVIRRRVGIRADQMSAPLKAGPGEYQLSWKCPYGVIESAINNHTWLTPYHEAAGISLPLHFPFAFPPLEGQQASVINNGSTDADWTARIYGPVETPRLVNNTTGGWVGLTRSLEAGEMVQLRSDDRSLLENGVAGAYRYDWLATGSRWFKLRPGPNAVSLQTTTDIGPATVEMTFRHTFLL